MFNEKVKLGLMPPLTGLVGIYGTEIVHAAQVACQEINENGGVLGKPLELVIEDDGSLPDTAVAAAKKLVNQHHCTAIIGNLLSNSRISVAYSVAEPRKIPYLNFSFYEGSILSRYFFNFAALPNQQIDKMIPYMRDKFGPRMFFAGNNYEWPRGSIHAGKLALEQTGGEVVGEEYCPIGVDAETIERLLDHVEAAKPDVFVPYFAGNDQVLLLTRFTERGLKNHMAVVMGHYDEMMASQLPPHVRDGFYSSNTYFMTIDSDQNRKYKSRLASLPDVDGIWPEGNGILTNFGEGTYLCVKAFAEAANKAGSLDAEDLVEALSTINISTPQGVVQMNPKHHHARVNTYLSRCSANGEFEIIKQFGAIEALFPERYKHQKIASQATLEDDIRLQARMLEQMTDGVILASSTDGSIVYVNSGAEKLFGYNKGEMTGMPMASLIDPSESDPEDTTTEIFRILNQTGEWQGEIRNIKKDGTSIWCSTTVSIFTHPVYGEVLLAVQGDITERKLADTASQLKHRISQATTSALSVYVTDMESVREIFTQMLDELLDIAGSEYGFIGEVLCRDDGTPYLKTQAITDISWDDESRKFYQENVPQGLEFNNLDSLFGHTIKTAEYTISNDPSNDSRATSVPEGHPPLNAFLGVPLSIGGKLVGMIGIANREGGYDESVIEPLEPFFQSCANVISAWRGTQQRLLAESELHQYKDQLEELVKDRTRKLHEAQGELVRKERLATLGQLTATVSHELRNPLGAMRPSLYVISKMSDKTDERVQKAIERVDRNIERCDRIIDELLDFTRITELDLQTTRVDEWLGSVIDEQAFPEGVHVDKDLSLDNIGAEFDSGRLRRAVINVVENACHSMMDGNQQVIDRANASLKIKTAASDGRIEITITDTGSGIPEDVLAKIYEPLFSTKGFGVGLGMPVVKQIMEQHSGGIDIDSREGKGTTVTLWLPVIVVGEGGDEVAA